MPVVQIEDAGDPRLAPFRNVPDPDLLREQGLFIAEGRLVVRTLLTMSPLAARSVLVTPAALEPLADLVPSSPDLAWLVVPQALMNEIAGFNIHRGCLAAGERPARGSVDALVAAAPRRLVVLEHVTNADNVGGIFRCAAAFGAGGIVLGPRCCDPLYRKAIRTSMGASLVVPYAVTDDWPAALDRLRSAGYRIAALTPEGEAANLDEVARDLALQDRLAILAGSEGTGLTEQALTRADLRVRIPIVPAVDSLNVTVAVGIALQRVSVFSFQF
jgi:tRNA G18 (ribose-2'-O)-methylase SpoU